MRKVKGYIVLPDGCPTIKSKIIHIELQDISYADVASKTIAKNLKKNVLLSSNGRISFEIEAPRVELNRLISLRIHIDINGNGKVEQGDFLTTAIYPIANAGRIKELTIPITSIQ